MAPERAPLAAFPYTSGPMELTAPETRVLGCLLEKQLATPNAYPLTLNALVTAANQTSNREPIVNYDDAEVVDALNGLRQKGVARVVLGSGQRAEKYRHVLEDVWGLDDKMRTPYSHVFDFSVSRELPQNYVALCPVCAAA